jgi:hypothetical protein
MDLKPRLDEYILLKDNQTLIGKKGFYSGDFVLFKIESEDKYIPLLKAKDLWNLIKAIPILKERLKSELSEKGGIDETAHWQFPFVQHIYLSHSDWKDKEIFIIRIQVGFSKSRSTVLVGFELKGEILTVIFRICLPDRLCLAFDLNSNNNQVNLVCGYLATNDLPGKLIQYFERVDLTNELTVNDQPSVIEEGRFVAHDIYAVKIIERDRVIALQRDNKLYDINLADLTYKTTEFDNLLKIIPVY